MVQLFIPPLRVDDRAMYEAWWMGAGNGGFPREPMRKACAGCGSVFLAAWQRDGSIGIETHICAKKGTLAFLLHRNRLGGLRPV